MKNGIFFSLPGNALLTHALESKLGIDIGSFDLHAFPDGESYLRIHAPLQHKTAILVCSLDHPNSNILPLMFMAKTIKTLGANKICLLSPYLPYLRQDTCFNPGEAITSTLFASYLSGWIDHLITLDPHLHRIHHLADIYTIDSLSVLHAAKKIAEWISHHVTSPFLIGPDEESEQRIAEVASILAAPYAIIKKTRHGDRSVSIDVPDIKASNNTPILIDDIISTGTSMLAAVEQLISRGYHRPICIGVHALFDHEVYDKLLLAGAQNVISCNTINHFSNQIDITDLIAEEVKRLLLC